MKVSIGIIILLFNFFSFAEENEIQSLAIADQKLFESLRLVYYKAVEDEDKLPEYEKFLKTNYSAIAEINNALALAYTAGIDIIKSRHAFWPLTKLNYLKKSLEKLKKALDLDPNNLEIRFMRFSMLHYVPGFLGYSNERDEDSKVIVQQLLKKNYYLIDKTIQKGIYQFVLDSERLSEKESELLTSQLKDQFANE